MDATTIAMLVGMAALILLHFVRGPNHQTSELKSEIAQLRADTHSELSRVKDQQQQILVKLLGEHYTKTEIGTMLTDIRALVATMQETLRRIEDRGNGRH